MLIDTLPAISILPPVICALAVAVTSLVTPWIVSLPGTETLTCWLESAATMDADVDVNVAFGNC